MRALCSLLVGLFLALGSGACGDDAPPGVPLVVQGSSEHTIVLQPGHSPSESWAATELRDHLEAATGATLPVVVWDEGVHGDPADPTALAALGKLIVLGRGAVADALGVTPADADLGEQGYRIRVVRPHLVIAGTGAAGTLYGVHRFLEEHVGIRWYAPGVVHVPDVANVSVPTSLDRTVRPAFLWRHTSYEWPGGEDAFFARQGDNSGSGGVDHEHGVQHDHDGRAHSYFWYVSPDEFFDDHPEYFSEIGGVRRREETQLCLTNPDVLDIVTERMLQRMADKPHARQHNFSQKDYYNYCECDACAAMNTQYGTTGGTQFWFVNQLAERTSAAYPDKLVGTLAYMYTEEPPVGLEMHPNAAVWLCHMYPSCDSHPIATCSENADYKRRAEAWAGITNHLYIWHYIVDFMHYYNPFPNFRAMAADLRFYRDIGVEGIYLQGMGHSGGGGEWSLLRPWYGMKLLWDPDQDAEALLRDFLQGYYGAASAPLWEYVQLLHDKVEDEDIHMHLYTNPAQGYLPDDVVDQALALFDQAEGLVADDDALLERVRVARMPLFYARFFPRNGYRIDGDRLVWEGEMPAFDELTEFLDRMEAHGFEMVREASGERETMQTLFMLLGQNLSIRVLENDHLRVEVVPFLGGRVLRMVDRATGESVTASNRRTSLYFPFAGGVEARVGGLFRFFGWVEPATVVDATELGLTTTQATFNGFTLERHYSLDPDAPVLHVTDTAINDGSGSEVVYLRSHLGLDLGDVRQSRVRFTTLGGGGVDQDMSGPITGLREGEHFYDDDAPAGRWTFSGPKGLEVTQSWDGTNVDFTWIYAYPESQQELEAEVWARRTVLGPGESVTLQHSLEVRPAP